MLEETLIRKISKGISENRILNINRIQHKIKGTFTIQVEIIETEKIAYKYLYKNPE